MEFNNSQGWASGNAPSRFNHLPLFPWHIHRQETGLGNHPGVYKLFENFTTPLTSCHYGLLRKPNWAQFGGFTPFRAFVSLAHIATGTTVKREGQARGIRFFKIKQKGGVTKMAFKEHNPQIFQFKDIDQSLTGVLINIQQNVGANESTMYTVESINTKDIEPGTTVNFWGSTILDQRMVGINIGDFIRVTFKGLGEAKSGKNAPKLFQVERDLEYNSTAEESPVD